MWDFSEVGAGKAMDESIKDHMAEMDSAWSHLGQVEPIGTAEKVEELLSSRRFKEAAGLRQRPNITV